MKKVVFLIVMIFSASLFAKTVTCENEKGSCEFKDDGSFSCECTNQGYGSSGAAAEEGTTLPTEEECLNKIIEVCWLPEGAVACDNLAGECVLYENDDYFCFCQNGKIEQNSGSENNCISDEDCEQEEICSDGKCTSIILILSEANECKEILEKSCGTEEPNINEICNEDSYPYCVDNYVFYMEKCRNKEIDKKVFEEMKENGWGEHGRNVAVCCNGYEKFKSEMDEFSGCLKENGCKYCSTCTEESFSYCTESYSVFMDKCENKKIDEKVFTEMKKDDDSEHWDKVGTCCNMYATHKTEMDELLECLKTKDCDECLEPDDDTGNEKDAETSDNDAPADSDTNQDDNGSSDGAEDDNSESDENSSSGCSAVIL